jgi:hypothetical protein
MGVNDTIHMSGELQVSAELWSLAIILGQISVDPPS